MTSFSITIPFLYSGNFTKNLLLYQVRIPPTRRRSVFRALLVNSQSEASPEYLLFRSGKKSQIFFPDIHAQCRLVVFDAINNIAFLLVSAYTNNAWPFYIKIFVSVFDKIKKYLVRLGRVRHTGGQFLHFDFYSLFLLPQTPGFEDFEQSCHVELFNVYGRGQAAKA